MTLGFLGDRRPAAARASLLRGVEPDDLVRFGLIPEFVGRLPVVAMLEDLDQASLVRVLTEPKNSLVRQYQTLFEFEGVTLTFAPDAIEAIAGLAVTRRIGARGLRAIVEELMLDLNYTIPDERSTRDLVVTRAQVDALELAAMEKAG